MYTYQHAVEKRMHAQPQNAEHDVHQMIEDLGGGEYLTQALGERALITHDTNDMYTLQYHLYKKHIKKKN